MFDYNISVHGKQGDDFHDLLEKNNDNVAKALLDWAEEFEKRAEYCKKLAAELKDHDVEAEADTNYIGLFGDEEFLDELAEDGLIERVEIEEEAEASE